MRTPPAMLPSPEYSSPTFVTTAPRPLGDPTALRCRLPHAPPSHVCAYWYGIMNRGVRCTAPAPSQATSSLLDRAPRCSRWPPRTMTASQWLAKRICSSRVITHHNAYLILLCVHPTHLVLGIRPVCSPSSGAVVSDLIAVRGSRVVLLEHGRFFRPVPRNVFRAGS
jgi:hypothetical protein